MVCVLRRLLNRYVSLRPLCACISAMPAASLGYIAGSLLSWKPAAAACWIPNPIEVGCCASKRPSTREHSYRASSLLACVLRRWLRVVMCWRRFLAHVPGFWYRCGSKYRSRYSHLHAVQAHRPCTASTSLARPASNNVQLNLTGLKQVPCNHVIVQPALSNEIAVYSALYVVSIKATTVK